MATNDRVARLRLRFETSQQDIQRAKSAVQGLLQQVDALETQQRQLDAQYARSIQVQMDNARALNQNSSFVSNLRSDLATLANEQENVNRAQTASNRSTNDNIDLLGRLKRAVESVTIAEQKRVGSVSAGTAGRLGQVDRFGRVGGQILGGLGAGEAANAVNLVGDVADSFTLLSPPMLAVTAVTGVLAAAYGHLRAETQRVTDLTTARLNAEADLARFLATATAEQTRERLQQAQQQLRVEEALLQARDEERRVMARQIAAGGTFDLLRETLNIAFGEFDALQASYANQEKIVADLRTEVGGLNTALESTDPVIRQILGVADQIRQTQAVLPDLIAKTKELSLAQEEEARTAQEAAQALANANSEKAKEIQLAKEAAIAASEAVRAQGITDVTNELFEAQTAVVDSSNRQREAQEALAATQSKVTDTIRELETSAEQERTANVRDAAEERAKIARESDERILEITRKGALSVLNAVGKRDAEAAFNAAQQAKEQIRDEKDSARKRQRDLDESLSKQNRVVDERLRERIRLEQIRGNDELNTRRQALLQAQTDLRNANNAELLIRRQSNITLGQEAFKGGQSMVAFFKAGIEQGMRGVGGSGKGAAKAQTSYFYTAPQFTGSLAPTSPFQFTAPQGGGSPVVFAPTITGQTRRANETQIIQHMGRFLDQVHGRSTPR